MPNYHLMSTIKTAAGVLKDDIQNNFSFICDSDTVAMGGPVTEVKAFYNSLTTLFGDLISKNGHTIKIYRYADAPPRAPIYTNIWNFSAIPSGASLPTEVSMCVSFQGAQVSGQPQARKRGRIYLPAFDATQIGADGRILATAVTTVRNAAQTLLTASDTALDWSWAVYSPTNASAVIVDNGWVDDEWDTQRRRGRIATYRQTFT